MHASEIEIKEIPVGLYQLTLTASDHISKEQQVSIAEGEKVVLNEQLQPSGVLEWTVSNPVGENSDIYSIIIKNQSGEETEVPFSIRQRQYMATLPPDQYNGKVYSAENILLDSQAFIINQGIITNLSTITQE